MRHAIFACVLMLVGAACAGEPSADEIQKLQKALTSKNAKQLEELLKSNPACANAILPPSQYTILAEASRVSSPEIVVLLLKNGADVNSPSGPRKFTALRNAGGTRPEIFKLLLDAGANPMMRDDIGTSDFDYAMMGYGRNKELVRAMLDSGKVRPNEPHPQSKVTAVTSAAHAGAAAVLEELVAKGGDLLTVTGRNFTVLHYACMGTPTPERIQCIQFLLSKKANLLAVDDIGNTPLHRAAGMNASAEMVEVLLSKEPKALNMLDKRGYTPLMQACERGNADAAIYLIKKGADMKVKAGGKTCLDLCKDETLQKLHAAGVKVK